MRNKDKYPETDVFHYHNANPKNRITGDCWLRAVSVGLDQDYNNTLKEMVDIQIKTGYALNDNKGIEKYLISKGWVKRKQPRKFDNTKYTGKEFCKYLNSIDDNHMLGNIIANIGGHHIVCIKPHNGRYKVYDIWDSSRKCVGNYYVRIE